MQIFFVSVPPKNERNCFLISALAFEIGLFKKMKALYHINYGVFDIREALIFRFDPFHILGAEIKK